MNVVIIGATFGIGYELGKKYLDQCDNLILLGKNSRKITKFKIRIQFEKNKNINIFFRRYR